MPDIFNSTPPVNQIPMPIVPKNPSVVPSKRDEYCVRKQRFGGVLSSFRFCPAGAGFINKGPEEQVYLILRRHPLTNVKWQLVVMVMLFVPGVLPFFPLLSFMPDRFQLIAVVFWYLVTTAFFLEEFLMWFFNVNIITNERVVDVNFSNLVYREISEADLDQIQDITVRVGSVIRTVAGYGDVLIQTASETQRINFEAVPNPDRVAKVLRDLREEEENRKQVQVN